MRLLPFRHQDDIDHAGIVALVERQAAGKENGSLPAQAQLQVVRGLRAVVGGDGAAAVDAAEQHGALVAPGEAGAEVGVPGITCRRLLGIDLDTHFQDRPAQPGTKALAEFGQDLILLPQDGPLADDLAQSGPGRGHLHRAGTHRAAGIHQPLPKPIGARLVIADGPQAPGCRVHLGLEKLVADRGLISQAHAGSLRRSRRPAPGNPGESQGRHFHDYFQFVAIELTGFDMAADGQRRRRAFQFQGHAPNEAARIEDHGP